MQGGSGRRRTRSVLVLLPLVLAGLLAVLFVPGAGDSLPGLGADPAAVGAPAAIGADRSSTPPTSPAAATPSATGTDRAAAHRSVQGLLDRRADALARRDRAAWLVDLDPRATTFRAEQDRAFAVLVQLRPERWSYRVAAEHLTPAPDRASVLPAGSWLAPVELRYRLAGVDDGDVVRRLTLTVVRRDGRWLVAGSSDGAAVGRPTEADVWDLPAPVPLTVVRGRRSVVVGSGTPDVLRRYAREVDAAVGGVRAVWPGPWPMRVAVIVPATPADLTRLVGGSAIGYEQIAAVTTGRVLPPRQDVPGGQGIGRVVGDRVVLNPATFPGLTALARRVVLAHEVTHVATRASVAGRVPMWLSEGFADYVGYRGSAVPVDVAAAHLLTQVRSGQVPRALPADSDFDPARGAVSPAYNGAWLACRLLALRYGETALVAVYRGAAQGPEGLAVALRRLGTDTARFTAAWRASLVAAAR